MVTERKQHEDIQFSLQNGENLDSTIRIVSIQEVSTQSVTIWSYYREKKLAEWHLKRRSGSTLRREAPPITRRGWSIRPRFSYRNLQERTVKP